MKIYLILFFTFSVFFNNLETSFLLYGNDIPEKIQLFLDKHFSKYEIEKLKYDAKDGECKVKYKNGIKIEFKYNGEWVEIESNYIPLPKSIIDILPVPAIRFISKKYPNRPITKIKHNSDGYKIKLENSVDLEFDNYGNLIKIDD